ncbi:MAG: hypothetical protein EAX81_02005 [Candidatus Thorarchaeota archaeon]|nr:hypothetical protein [Candidatus Thorarchaeota archaeon]
MGAVLLLLVGVGPQNAIEGYSFHNDANYTLSSQTEGGYVDNINYRVISSDWGRVQALLNNEIDLIGVSVDDYYVAFEDDPDVTVKTVLGSGLGVLYVNCDKYPFTIAGFRRAFALALDKVAAAATMTNPWLATPYQHQDTFLPASLPFSAEEDLGGVYYDESIILANNILDEEGFDDVSGNAHREAPNGDTLTVLIEVADQGIYFGNFAQILANALDAISINGSVVITPIEDIGSRVMAGADYDIAFLHHSLTYAWYYDVRRELKKFDSRFSMNNWPHFTNSTYDSLCDELESAETFAEASAVVKSMEEIILEQCPVIPVGCTTEKYAFRTDRFEEYRPDPTSSWGYHFPWGTYLARLRATAGGPFGGTLRIGIDEDLSTFTYWRADRAEKRVLSHTMLPLLNLDTNGNLIPWLAAGYTMETHDDNGDVPVGRTRIHFSIREGMTWSDGSPITALDAADSIETFYAATDRDEYPLAVSVHVPATYQLWIEVEEDPSFWLLVEFAYISIFPEGALDAVNPSTGDGYDPVLGYDPFVTGGPFTLNEYVADDHISFSLKIDFFANVERIVTTTTTTTSATTTTTTTTDELPTELLLMAGGAIAIVVVIVTVVAMRKK